MIRTPVPFGITRLGIRRPRYDWQAVADTFGVPRWMVRPGMGRKWVT
jgi:hypothetical protein